MYQIPIPYIFWYRWVHLEVLDLSSPWFEVLSSKRPKRPLVKLKLETQRKANFFASILAFYITYNKYDTVILSRESQEKKFQPI